MPSLRQKLVSSVTRRYPLLSGCGSFANSRVVRLAAGTCQGLAWSRLDCGLEILVPLDDYVGRAVYFVGDLDRKISEVIKRVVRPGDHVLDIGANLGIVSLPLALLVGEHGVVHAFEPNPAVGELLVRSAERNGLKNVRLHACALGAEDGQLTLHYPKGNSGEGTLVRTGSPEGWNSVQVPIRSLSALADEFDLSRIRLVKMDVEGYEFEVLRGARRWLTSHPPDTFLFENAGHGLGEADSVPSQFAEWGYALYSIPKTLLSLRLVPYHPGASQTGPSHDMIAIRRDREREIVSLFEVQD